jgi:hypothetical protein
MKKPWLLVYLMRPVAVTAFALTNAGRYFCSRLDSIWLKNKKKNFP